MARSDPAPAIDPEAVAILDGAGTRKTFLVVTRPDGSTTTYPMLATARAGGLEFTTYRKSAKAQYLAANPYVCCVLVDERGATERGDGVASDPTIVVWGDAVLLEDGESFLSDLSGPPLSPPPIAVPDSIVTTVGARLRSGSRVVFRVEVARAVRLLPPPAAFGGSATGEVGRAEA